MQLHVCWRAASSPHSTIMLSSEQNAGGECGLFPAGRWHSIEKKAITNGVKRMGNNLQKKSQLTHS